MEEFLKVKKATFSGGLLIVSVVILASPSVIRKAHPEFRQGKVTYAEPVTEK